MSFRIKSDELNNKLLKKSQLSSKLNIDAPYLKVKSQVNNKVYNLSQNDKYYKVDGNNVTDNEELFRAKGAAKFMGDIQMKYMTWNENKDFFQLNDAPGISRKAIDEDSKMRYNKFRDSCRSLPPTTVCNVNPDISENIYRMDDSNILRDSKNIQSLKSCKPQISNYNDRTFAILHNIKNITPGGVVNGVENYQRAGVNSRY